MGKLRGRLSETTFHCHACGEVFDAAPARIEDSPDTPWHPWEYFADCVFCGTEAGQRAQDRHLLKMWAKSTGPKTAEGKAAVTRNLAGHPTPEEALRTRFNAMKHGLSAEVATYFPAKPGRYPHCDGCVYRLTCYPGEACRSRTELFLRHRVAFETRDPSMLSDLRADLHAMVMAVLQDMMRAIMADGVRLKTPAWYYDSKGKFHLAGWSDEDGNRQGGEEIDFDDESQRVHAHQIYEIKEHPLLKRIGDWVKSMGLDLNSQGMTPKVQDDADVIRGHLSQTAENEQMALEYRKRNAEALENLSGMFERARQRVQADPVLIEHRRGDDDG